MTDLTIKGKDYEINFPIDDWATIEEGKLLVGIGLVILKEQAWKHVRNTLDFYGIYSHVSTDNMLVLSKPTVFTHSQREKSLQLEYYK